MSSTVTVRPSSWRSRFSSSTFSENGSRDRSPSAFSASGMREVVVGEIAHLQRAADLEHVMAGYGQRSSPEDASRCRAVGGAPISRKDVPAIDPLQIARQTRRIGAARRLPRLQLPGHLVVGPNRGNHVWSFPLYLGLFASAVTSATLLPGTSEILMLGLLIQGFELLDPVARGHRGQRGRLDLELVARALRPALPRPALVPGRRSGLARAQGWYHRWGQPSLLFAWLPGVGDAFTVAAGVMRVPLLTFLVMVTIAKGGRYAAILGAGRGLDIGSWF